MRITATTVIHRNMVVQPIKRELQNLVYEIAQDGGTAQCGYTVSLTMPQCMDIPEVEPCTRRTVIAYYIVNYTDSGCTC